MRATAARRLDRHRALLAGSKVRRRSMKAKDIMVAPVISVKPNATVKDVAKLFMRHRISAVPVVDDQGKIVGIVSERDLMQRAEIGTDKQRSWWLRLLTEEQAVFDYIKAHAIHVSDVMTRDVVTTSPDTPLRDVALLLEKKGIKRVPVVRNGQLVGIVSRANLVQALTAAGSKLEIPLSDAAIREKLLSHLKAQSWAPKILNVMVNGGVADLWGVADTEAERNAIRVAAETTPGIRAVNDHLLVWPQVGSFE
jgi:CBS-domain-containing membrane protein